MTEYINCDICLKSFDKEKNFYKTFTKDIQYFKVIDSSYDSYVINNGIDSEDFNNLIDNEIIEIEDIEINNSSRPVICGKCIELCRKYIKYVNILDTDYMVLLATSNFNF